MKRRAPKQIAQEGFPFIAIGSSAGYTERMTKARWFLLVPGIGFMMALGLHLWHIGTPNVLVSDEISFVNDGWSYVTHQPYFDPHPPLGKLMLGVVMKLFGYAPDVWRSVNAIEGALLIPLLWWIVRRLTKSNASANIAVVLGLVDGLVLADSRLGMINIPFVLFSIAGFAAILTALSSPRPRRWLFLAGLVMGLAVSTKWLAALVIIPAILVWIWPKFFGQQRTVAWTGTLKIFSLLVLVVWPMILYSLVFVVHFAWLHLPNTFWSLNAHMLRYHLSVPATGDPNAQPWWGWLLAWRPFPYWASVQGTTVSTIRSLPNVWVWWTGSLLVLWNLVRGWKNRLQRLLNVLILFVWIPFAVIQRVMYSYHALLFDVVMIIMLSVWLGKLWSNHRRMVFVYLGMSIVTFIFFAPWWLNIPLSTQQNNLRTWLPSWSITR